MDTELALDASFSGARTIVCTIGRSDAEKTVGGGVDALDAFIRLNCPEELDWTKAEDRSNLTYTFTLSFRSEEEYVQKVEALLGRRPQVLFAAPDTPFSSGYRISEDFSSADLMDWFQTLAVQKGLIAEGTTFWQDGSTAVRFGGEVTGTGVEIDVNRLEAASPERVILATTLKKDQSFERTVTFLFSPAALEGREAEFQAYFEDRVPEGGNLNWSETAAGRSVVLQFSAEDAQALREKTAQALDSAQGQILLQKESGSPFSSHLVFEEGLRFSAFLSNDGKVPVDYSFRSELPSDLSSAELYQDGAWISAGEVSGKEFHYSGEVGLLELRLTTQSYYQVENISIRMQQLSSGRFQREMLFTFEQTADQEGPALLKQYFEEKAAPFTQITASQTSCMLTVTGSAEELGVALEKLFGPGNSVRIENDYGFQLMQSVSYTDSIQLSAFFEEAELTGQTVLYTFYPLASVTDFTQQTAQQAEGQILEYKESEAFCTLPAGGNAVLTVKCGSINYLFVFVLGGGVLLGFALIATVMFWILRFVRRREKAAKTAGTKTALPALEAGETREEDYTPIPSGGRCAACGAALYEGMTFCIRCGEPVPPPETPEPDGRVCPVCGGALYEGMAFCVQCGERVEVPESGLPEENAAEPLLCTRCGAVLPEGMLFCINCGAEQMSDSARKESDSSTQHEKQEDSPEP